MSQEAPAFLSAQERGRIHLIAIDDVIYLKAELKYVTVRTAQREYLIEDALARLEQSIFDVVLNPLGMDASPGGERLYAQCA